MKSNIITVNIASKTPLVVDENYTPVLPDVCARQRNYPFIPLLGIVGISVGFPANSFVEIPEK